MRFGFSIALIASVLSTGTPVCAFSTTTTTTSSSRGYWGQHCAFQRKTTRLSVGGRTRTNGPVLVSSPSDGSVTDEEFHRVVRERIASSLDDSTLPRPARALSGKEVKSRLVAQLSKLRLKDSTSKKLSKEVSDDV